MDERDLTSVITLLNLMVNYLIGLKNTQSQNPTNDGLHDNT